MRVTVGLPLISNLTLPLTGVGERVCDICGNRESKEATTPQGVPWGWVWGDYGKASPGPAGILGCFGTRGIERRDFGAARSSQARGRIQGFLDSVAPRLPSVPSMTAPGRAESNLTTRIFTEIDPIIEECFAEALRGFEQEILQHPQARPTAPASLHTRSTAPRGATRGFKAASSSPGPGESPGHHPPRAERTSKNQRHWFKLHAQFKAQAPLLPKAVPDILAGTEVGVAIRGIGPAQVARPEPFLSVPEPLAAAVPIEAEEEAVRTTAARRSYSSSACVTATFSKGSHVFSSPFHFTRNAWRSRSKKDPAPLAEGSAPPSPSAATAKIARPGTDARVPDEHQQPAALQALPPALPTESAPKPPPTKSTEQPTPVLSVSERLWNAAYDSLETDNAELVMSYVRTLETVLGANPGVAPDTNISAELHNPTKRQTHMRRLVEEGQAKISRASKTTNGAGDVADFVLSVKGMIDLAVQCVPQAALPWAGVCVGLQILQNPAQATKSNLAGIAHVISRMDWYCALTEHLLNRRNVAAGKAFQAVLRQLETSIVELYRALLQYQMKSVCSYYRNQGLVFLRGMLNLDDWDGDLKLVTNAEAIIQNDAAQSFQEQTKTSLGKLVEHAEGMESRLGDIHQDIRDFISLQKDARRDDVEAACRKDRVVDPQHGMERIEKSKDELLNDAYKWILRTPEYTAFTNWNDSGSDYTALNNATAVLRSLIWLLLLQQPCLISHLLQKYKESGADLFRDRNAFIALSEAFRNMLKDPQLSPVYLAVDALDECAQGRSDLIHLISTSLNLSQRVRWLLSSRPEVDLLAALKEQGVNSLVELDTQRLEEFVNAYINHKLIELKDREGYKDCVLADISHEVRQRAENTFLWVALVFKELSSVEGWDAVETVQSIPPGLTELYGHMMARINEGKEWNWQGCKIVLAATFLAYRPPSLSELVVVPGLPAKINPRTILDGPV
ncbi:hypothetical protein N658DRAFT_555574 [Parathielavia hyrcaniae]|uniref:NWD NACHT-NTPase N-terminal domain-containing protein n=1 Tax=Parathielavia hyrcaniae TaxID=113614 RepID=A0AAN6T6A8_9PEZI|nr:hypothetical protein N658DRAFT_555574 [Parathielavia hyrcaniae]